MTLTASPYAVFKAEEWVSPVAQPIGIAQCIRLNSKKLSPISSSIKKKRSTSLREGFSEKHVQLAFAWYVNISIISSTSITEDFFSVVLFLMEIIWFHVVVFGWGNERKRLACVQSWPHVFTRLICLYEFSCHLWSVYGFYMLYWLTIFIYCFCFFTLPLDVSL